jgi:hypothetical protein
MGCYEFHRLITRSAPPRAMTLSLIEIAQALRVAGFANTSRHPQ